MKPLRSWAAILTVTVITTGMSFGAAQSCNIASGPTRVALLELYTSEGCDSCPPTDRWISGLPGKNLGTRQLVALAFHVDYWNHLGWVDPFAQSVFSERQRAFARRRGASFVFTPQLLLNGADYRRGVVFDDIRGKVSAINTERANADVKMAITAADASIAATVEASVHASAGAAQLFIALYENNLSTQVMAGENKGRKLRHDYVVRELAGPFALDSTHTALISQAFRIAPTWKPRDLHVAAFVQHPKTGTVLQALAGSCP